MAVDKESATVTLRRSCPVGNQPRAKIFERVSLWRNMARRYRREFTRAPRFSSPQLCIAPEEIGRVVCNSLGHDRQRQLPSNICDVSTARSQVSRNSGSLSRIPVVSLLKDWDISFEMSRQITFYLAVSMVCCLLLVLRLPFGRRYSRRFPTYYFVAWVCWFFGAVIRFVPKYLENQTTRLRSLAKEELFLQRTLQIQNLLVQFQGQFWNPWSYRSR